MVTAKRWFWVLVGLWVVVAAAPFVLYADQLPDVIASHWGVDGRPDGTMPVWGVVLATLGVIGLGAGIGFLMRSPAGPAPESVGIAAFLGALATGLAWSTVLANRGISDWRDAGSIGWVEVLIVVGAALIAATLAFLVWRKRFPTPAPASGAAPGTSPVIPVSVGERVAWTGSATIKWPLVVVGIGVIAFYLMPRGIQWLMLIAPILSMLMLRAQATVSESGLDVRLGPLRVRRIGLDQIDQATTEHIEPMKWGGWGWRVIPNASAIVLRRGEALVIRYPSGRRFAVTVDDSATGAGLINGLLARARGAA